MSKNKLQDLKNEIFEQVLYRLESFSQDFISEEGSMFNENYYAPDDLFVVLSPSDFKFLMEYKNERY